MTTPDGFHEFEWSRWQAAAAPYQSNFASLTGQTISGLLPRNALRGGNRLLDVACGPGDLTAAAARKGYESTGLDFSQAMLTLAASTHPQCRFSQGDAQALPFDADTFDAVCMNFGILHLSDPDRAISDACRVLRAGGEYSFTAWAAPPHTAGFQIILDLIDRHALPAELPPGPPFFDFGRAGRALFALRRAGFAGCRGELAPLIWRLRDADEYFQAFLLGTARTGGVLRSQPDSVLQRIREDLEDQLAPYKSSAGLSIPMSAFIWRGRKHVPPG